MITQGPFNLALGTPLPLNDPGANSNNPATAIQVQNASPFIIEVNAGGRVLTIQSFTAQTVPTSGGGQQMSVTPLVANPPGQSTAAQVLTVVWLLAGESPPMLDGPLTAAAVIAAASAPAASLLVGPITVSGAGGNFVVPLPPNVRTLLIECNARGSGVTFLVRGVQSQFNYYGPTLSSGKPAYLGWGASNNLLVVPILAVLDTSVQITVVGAAGTETFSVYGDVTLFPESTYYNGAAQAVSVVLGAAGGPSNILVGPARLLTLEVEAISGATAEVFMGGTRIARVDAAAAGTVAPTAVLAFPPNTILPADSNLALTQTNAGATVASLTYAYP